MYIHCFSATDSLTQQLSNKQNLPKRESKIANKFVHQHHRVLEQHISNQFTVVQMVSTSDLSLPFTPSLSITLSPSLPRAHTHAHTHTPHFRYWAMPGFWLKRQILMNLPSEDLEISVANSIDFMVERVSGATLGDHSSNLNSSLCNSWTSLSDHSLRQG